MLDLVHNKAVRYCLAVFLATIAFTQWGYLWYATVFDDLWQSLIGRSEQDLVFLAEQRGWVQSFNTYFISYVQATGLLTLSLMARAKSFLHYLLVALICTVLIATPVLGNAVLFAGQSYNLWVLDFTHFILGYAGMALTFWICIECLPTIASYIQGRAQVSKRLKMFMETQKKTDTSIPWITRQRHRLR